MDMTSQGPKNAITVGLEQLNAGVQAGWTLVNAGAQKASDTPMRRFAELSSDLQKFHTDAFGRHRGVLVRGPAALSNWTPALLPGHHPQDVIEIPASLFETSALRLEIWADLTKQVGDRYAALAHQMAQDVDQAIVTSSAEKPQATPRSAVKKAR
jgi:hypothetical protein